MAFWMVMMCHCCHFLHSQCLSINSLRITPLILQLSARQSSSLLQAAPSTASCHTQFWRNLRQKEPLEIFGGNSLWLSPKRSNIYLQTLLLRIHSVVLMWKICLHHYPSYGLCVLSKEHCVQWEENWEVFFKTEHQGSTGLPFLAGHRGHCALQGGTEKLCSELK